jgi:hypothetical protein
MGIRKRYRLLDVDRLLNLLGTEDLVSFRKIWTRRWCWRLRSGGWNVNRVGPNRWRWESEAFVRQIQAWVERRRTVIRETGAVWTLQKCLASSVHVFD